jgi:hypothetical protein
MDMNNWLNTSKKHLTYLLLIIFSKCLYATEPAVTKLELTAIAALSSVELTQDKWLTALPVNGSDERYFLATENGKIYTLNNEHVSSSVLLDLKVALKNPSIIALTAIVLDPSFNYRDRTGYNTFYTAHVEPHNASNSSQVNKIIRDISDANMPGNLPYNAVIMRWQLHKPLNQPAEIIAQHEVMRIAIHQEVEAIKQLSFNPYTESWHDDFGLLYALIAMTKTGSMSEEALYSGAILRIKPERFGVQNYTTPINNPFIKQVNIRNEIAFMAGREIINFNWTKKGSYSLLIQLLGSEKNQFIQAKLGDDWRQDLPSKPWQVSMTNNINNDRQAILYHGRALKNLRGKILQLAKDGSDWQLQALSLKTPTQAQKLSTAQLHHLSNTVESSNFSLHRNSNSELLLLEHNQQLLFAVKATKTPVGKTDLSGVPVNSKSTGTSNSAFIICIIMISTLAAYLWYRQTHVKRKQHFLYQQWTNFEVSSATGSLSLYKRHNDAIAHTIKISSLKSSELLLNDEIITIVSADVEQSFSNSLEDGLLTTFAKEHRLKMVDDKQRKIQLRLTDKDNVQYIFALYYRVGNIRHTKLKYNKVLEKVIDWNWFFSQFINTKNTSKRKIRIKPSAKIMSAKPDSATSLTQPPNQHQAKSALSNSHVPVESIKTKHIKQFEHNDSTNQDTELVSALDKLIEMKKQGYLSDMEFSAAKAKILKNLINE